MKLLPIIVVLLISGFLFVFTGQKLYKMAMIRGFIPGAKVEKRIITQKWNQYVRQRKLSRNAYWISWTDKSIEEVGNHRVNIHYDDWQKLSVGDSIDLVFIPGDNRPFTKNDIFADNGNFIFDSILLIIELTGLIWSTFFIISLLKKKPVSP